MSIGSRLLFLSWTIWIQSTPSYPASFKIQFIFSSLRLGRQKRSLSFRFPHQNPVYISLFPFASHVLLSAFPYVMTVVMFGENCKSWNSSSCTFVTSSLLRQNIFLSSVFAKTLRPSSSLSVTNQVPHQRRAFYPFISDGEGGIQIPSVASSVLNKQSLTAGKGCFSSLFVYERITLPQCQSQHVIRNVTQVLGRIIWKDLRDGKWIYLARYTQKCTNI